MDVNALVTDTLQLRLLMLRSLDDVVNKRITPSDARARALLARAILDTVRIEIIAAREGLAKYAPINLQPDTKLVEGSTSRSQESQS